MSNEKATHSAPRRLRALLLGGLLAFFGAAFCLAWHYHRHTAAVANSLIQSLAESISTTNRSSTQIRVALVDANLDDGSATKDLKRFLNAQSTFAWKAVSPTDVRGGVLTGFDVVILPGGNARKQATALGNDGKKIVREFVQAGGGYIGICGGAFLGTAKYDPGMALVNAKPLIGQMDVPGEGTVSITARGAGIVKIQLTAAGKRVFGDLPSLVDIRYSGGPILSPAGMTDLPEYVSLAVFRTEVWEYDPQRGTMIDTPAIVAGRFGTGHVVIFSPHPEMTEGLESLVGRAILATARCRRETGEDP